MNKNQPAFFNVGGATLLMLFAVLCLTVFAVLSLISAKSQSALVQKSADAVTAYYQADTRAAEIYDEVAAGNLSSVKTQASAAGTSYTYSVKIDDNQELQVALTENNGKLAIVTWKVCATGDWNIDEHLDVWDGQTNE